MTTCTPTFAALFEAGADGMQRLAETCDQLATSSPSTTSTDHRRQPDDPRHTILAAGRPLPASGNGGSNDFVRARRGTQKNYSRCQSRHRGAPTQCLRSSCLAHASSPEHPGPAIALTTGAGADFVRARAAYRLKSRPTGPLHIDLFITAACSIPIQAWPAGDLSLAQPRYHDVLLLPWSLGATGHPERSRSARWPTPACLIVLHPGDEELRQRTLCVADGPAAGDDQPARRSPPVGRTSLRTARRTSRSRQYRVAPSLAPASSARWLHARSSGRRRSGGYVGSGWRCC
jgi:hypothetical protein